MDNLQTFQRPFVWLKRFRHRCGYGIHSPFAFDFITTVIYEKSHYYAYSELEGGNSPDNGFSRKGRSRKINRLLFRLVNRTQPEIVVEAGDLTSASQYIRAAKKNVTHIHFAGYQPIALPEGKHIDFLYVHCSKDAGLVEKAVETCLKYTENQTVFVLEGIGYSMEMKRLWNSLVKDERVGTTFDLYDLGIMFFDMKRIKQHYIVNF